MTEQVLRRSATGNNSFDQHMQRPAAAQANVRATVIAEQPANVPGMTPQADARRWQLRGQLPDARPVAEQLQVFAHGTRVYQASVIGPAADDAHASPFFDALRVVQ